MCDLPNDNNIALNNVKYSINVILYTVVATFYLTNVMTEYEKIKASDILVRSLC